MLICLQKLFSSPIPTYEIYYELAFSFFWTNDQTVTAESDWLQNMISYGTGIAAERTTENKMWLYEWMKWRWLCGWKYDKMEMKNGDGRNLGEENFIGGIW